MLARTKFFLFLLVLHFPPSLHLPLAQQDVVSATKNKNLMVSGTNEIEQLTPTHTKVTELIQEIDVKDKEDKVVSNINQVVIGDKYDDAIVTSKILPNAPGENANSTVTNATSLNTNSHLKERINLASVSTTLKPLDGDNILDVTEPVIIWRSDVSVKRKSKKQNKLYYLNASKNNSESSVENTDIDLLDSNHNSPVDQNDEEKSIFVLLNSGNIDGLSVNSPVNNDNLQTNSDNNTIENLGSNNFKIINDLVNTTINDVLSKILQKDHTILNTKHIFLLLNSGSIKNIHISSPVLENIAKTVTLTDRSRRHLNDTHTNNSTVEYYITLNQPVNTTVAYYNNTDETPVEEISSGEAPAFRSLIPDKIRKLQQVTNAVSTTIEPNTTKDHNLVIKLAPDAPPISIDLDQIPFNNIFDGAVNLMKRFKRNTLEENTKPTTDCNEKQIGKNTIKSCKKANSNNELSFTPTRKSLMDTISTVLNMYDTVELECPLSVIVKLFTDQVIDKLSKNDTDGVINKILSSFLNGNEGAVTLATKELLSVPIPVKLRLQLVHGKTKEFLDILQSTVDATLCSLT